MNKLKIIGIFLLLPIIGYTQGIDKKEFNRLVDYVNCRYTKAYIESLRDNSSSEADMEADMEAYDKNIKSKIECSINKPLEYGELSNLLNENKWRTTKEKLTDIINKKKNDFNANLSTDGVIRMLINVDDLPQFKEILNTEQSKLQKEFEKHLEAKANRGLKPIGLWVLGIINTLLTLIIGVWVSWSLLFKKRVKNNDSNEHKINNLNFTQKEIEEIRKLLSDKEEKIQIRIDSIDTRIRIIENEIEALCSKIKNNPPPVDPIVGGGGKESQIKYLKTAPQGVFLKEFESPNGCYFKLYDINDNSGKFKFCGDIHEAIANRSAIFDDTSEPFNIPQNITELITERPGIAIYQNGKWQVREKAIINFK